MPPYIFFHGAASLAPWSELEQGHICMATCIFYQCGEHKKGIRLGKKLGLGGFQELKCFITKEGLKESKGRFFSYKSPLCN